MSLKSSSSESSSTGRSEAETTIAVPTGLLEGQNTTKDAEKNSAEKKIKYPISVFLIVANEFCERFSYYGLRTVLTLYFTDALGYTDDTATVMYHVFVMLCYFMPIFGAIIADTWAGKFMTILVLSILYAIGEIILALAAIPNTLPQEAFSMIGLAIIAIGTGGIKPCVSAFGGDQFVRPQQDRQLETFFAIFYFSINAGSLISTFVTPILRADVQCFEQETCFSLAFGVPAALMIIAVAIFIAGKPLYKIKKPEGNIVMDVSRCIGHAIKRKWNDSKEKKRDHWLDFASDKYDAQLIADIKRVLSVLVLFIPIPIFWALFDQQGSRWTLQAKNMNGEFGEGGYAFKADQMQIVNPLLILLLVPLFESVVYPAFAKCINITPLRKMTTGGILAGVAFVISAIVELQLEPTYAMIPGPELSQLDFYNTLPCPIKLTIPSTMVDYTIQPLDRFKLGEGPDFITAGMYNISAELELTDGKCGGLAVSEPEWNDSIDATSENAYSVFITLRNERLFLSRMSEPVKLEKSDIGKPTIGFLFNLNEDNAADIEIQMVKDSQVKYTFYANVSADLIVQTQTQVVDSGSYTIKIPKVDQSEAEVLADGIVQVKAGGCYVVVLQRSLNESTDSNYAWTFQVTPENSIHLMWLIPQYFVMTMGEVLMSVTGLQFSFTQAPPQMRSVMASMWQLTVAFGNLIVVIITELKIFPRQSMEFFLFAGLMFADMIVLALLAMGYQYVTEDDVKSDGISRSRKSSTSSESNSSDLAKIGPD